MGPYLAHPNSDKQTNKGENLKNRLRFSSCQMQGWRRGMQDATICENDIGYGNALYAVFDGHGGPQVAKLVEKIFLTFLKNSLYYKQGRFVQCFEQIFRKIDEYIQSPQGQEQLMAIHKKFNNSSTIGDQKISFNAGCTANVVLVTPKRIIVANAGDSRSVLSRAGKAISLSIDNKPQLPNEIQRIQRAGGSIVNGRVNGSLNLSRSFGDFCYKQLKNRPYDQQLIICKPQIKQFERKPQDQFIIIACDGIWEKYLTDSQGLVTKILNQRKKNDAVTILTNLFDYILAKQTAEQLGCDNMSAIIVEFL